MKPFLLCILGPLTISCACAQQAPPATDWQHLQKTPAGTRIHVSADHKSRTCSLVAIDEDKLTCSGSVTGSPQVFARTEIKSIKVTRYAVSTLGGAAIGAGTGLIIGVAAAPNNSGSFQIVSNKVVWLVFSVIGALAGALVGGPLDIFRGPTLYRR